MKLSFENLKNEFALINVQATEKMINQFSDYYNILLEWNKVMNLTAITDLNEVIQKHFLDSAALGGYYNLEQKLRLADLGTGAGFPGIPLKILFPELEITLIDSVGKRINFLNEVISRLGLINIQAIHGRAEDFARMSNYREKFDICVSRAVANLTTLSEYCIPFVKKHGMFVSYKSANVNAELEQAGHAIFLLGGKLDKVEEFQIPHTDYQRTLIFIQKIHKTDIKYPRKAGIPTKTPLI